MSDRRPPSPQGLDQATKQMTVYGKHPLDEGARPGRILGLVWCAVGGVLIPLAPVVSCALVAFGAAILFGAGDLRDRLVGVVVSLLAGVVSTLLAFGAHDIPSTLVAVVGALVLAGLVSTGHLRTGHLIVSAIAMTVAMVCIDVVSTSMQGTTITAVITDVVDNAVQSSMSAVDLDGTAALLEARETMLALWPTVYFVVGVGMALCSLLGAWLGARASGRQPEAGMMARYDVPLWVTLAFAAGVAAQLLGTHLPANQEQASMLGANVVTCSRIVLAQQGLSVLVWWMRKRPVPTPTRAVAIMVALWLEMSLALMSIMGIVDVALNFRRLERQRPDLVPRPTRER